MAKTRNQQARNAVGQENRSPQRVNEGLAQLESSSADAVRDENQGGNLVDIP